MQGFRVPGDNGATVTVRLEPDHDRCSQRPPQLRRDGGATVTPSGGQRLYET